MAPPHVLRATDTRRPFRWFAGRNGRGVIREQVDRGITAVVAMHDLNLASRFCNKLAMLHDRRVFAAGGPDILTADNVRAVYDVEATVLQHGDRRLVIPEEPVADSTVDGMATEHTHD